MPTKIKIPSTCVHTEALRVIVDPECSKMYIQLVDTVTGNVFQDGKIENRRGREIAIFMFRNLELIEKDGELVEQKHLTKGEKVLCKVRVIDDQGEEIKKEQLVEVL